MGDDLESQPETDQRDPSLMSMGRFEAVVLFILYFFVIIYATSQLTHDFIKLSASSDLSELSIFRILIYSSLAGASVFYARKLYKAGINSSYDFSPKSISISRISTFAYFLIRLPASAIFSLILYALWRISLDLSVESAFKAEHASRYLFLLMGFFSGFSSGKFIAYFEKDGMNIARGGGNG